MRPVSLLPRFALRPLGRLARLAGIILLALAATACAGVQPHYELPELAVADPAFLLTLEAYTSTAHGGNTVDVLLNGDQIFPAALAAIRAARTTITYACLLYT